MTNGRQGSFRNTPSPKSRSSGRRSSSTSSTLRLIALGANPPEVPQRAEDATYAHKLKKTDGLIHWNDPVLVIERKIRAYAPWPGCYAFLPERFRRKGNSGRVVIVKAEIVANLEPGWAEAAPGTVLKCVSTRAKNDRTTKLGPIVKCGDTALKLIELKPEGGALMDGGAFLQGRQLQEGVDSLLEA